MIHGMAIMVIGAALCAGCVTTIEREHAGDDEESAGQAGGGGALAIDADRQCDLYRFELDSLVDCDERWNVLECATRIRAAVDVGCLEETLTLLDCLAATCEDSVECAAEEREYKRCHGTLDE